MPYGTDMMDTFVLSPRAQPSPKPVHVEPAPPVEPALVEPAPQVEPALLEPAQTVEPAHVEAALTVKPAQVEAARTVEPAQAEAVPLAEPAEGKIPKPSPSISSDLREAVETFRKKPGSSEEVPGRKASMQDSFMLFDFSKYVAKGESQTCV